VTEDKRQQSVKQVMQPKRKGLCGSGIIKVLEQVSKIKFGNSLHQKS